MNLAGPLRYWAKRDPERMAIVMGDRELTWAQLDDRTSRLAQGLRGLGVGLGDRVATLVPNSVEFCETVLACFKLGAIFVPLNYRLAPAELAEIIDRSGTTTIVADRGMLDPLLEYEQSVGRLRCIVTTAPRQGESLFEEVVSASAPEDPLADFAGDHPAFICYTSGTTGVPKGAVLSHRNVLAVCAERIAIDAWNSTDSTYFPYALAFTGGLIAMWMPLYSVGGQTVLEAEFDPELTLEVFERRRITQFIAVGSILEALTQATTFETTDLSSLRMLGTGGQAISVAMLQAFGRRGLHVCQGYGLTESGGLCLSLSGEMAEAKLGSTGIPTPQTTARVVDVSGEDVAPGEIGELWLRGPQIMERYWEDPTATSDAMVGDWLRTGDLVRQDDDGYFYVVDRAKDMLISGGVNIYPAEIERVLAGYPGISELVVIAAPDEKWGEVPALIARRDQHSGERPSADELIEYCRQHLARYKAPKYVLFQDDPLPRGLSNKILKSQVREQSLRLLGLTVEDIPSTA
ncbi:fatty-acyl-CoA synthase [Rhodococcus sp. OK611]|jgi:fatty-acyl-CoA synthase|uniref:class I adenylate-forming enzyme family protein n=1 Tax=unclassified Rhodococcus (in: high G+C Gram-positive bacteria) TaxID=192944 RepID=UPI000BD2F7CE|nr:MULTISPECIES: AMP-binding protein [unclassified Rhodococcus (in: high G+C Gram-positive bacteria)]PTR44996.1 fatty-acyl-CoA synthase [Rhodococcus sp. OK611]SNX89331.1 fatty-acyl-CoA synthase [Rhodococcus sp. OK270]